MTDYEFGKLKKAGSFPMDEFFKSYQQMYQMVCKNFNYKPDGFCVICGMTDEQRETFKNTWITMMREEDRHILDCTCGNKDYDNHLSQLPERV